MKIKQNIIFTLFCFLIFTNGYSQDCPITNSSLGISTVKNTIAFSKAKYNVDADGAPNAYRIDGKGLSYTCDGVVAIENGKKVTPKSDKLNWQSKCNQAWALAKKTDDFSKVHIFGFEKDEKNKPLIQGKNDPLEGQAYISTTRIEIPSAPRNTQRKQIDSTKIPYIVLPADVVKKYHVKPADIAIVFRPSNGKMGFAIYADQGELGEGSIKLHYDLGNNPMIVKDGVQRAKHRIEDKIVTFVFPGKSSDRTLDLDAWLKQIESIGNEQLEAFGGVETLKYCSSKL